MTGIKPEDFDSKRLDPGRRLHFLGVRNDDRYDGIGAQFTAAREQSGLEIVQIAQRLRIRREHLTAIEQGRFDDLPAFAYGIGFVRSYAEFLGLDSTAAVQVYKLETKSDAQREPLVFPTGVLIERMPRGWLVGMSAVLAAVVFGAWYYLENSGRVSVNAVPPAPALAVSAAVPSGPRPEIAVTALPSLSDVPAAVPDAAPSDSAADLDPAIGRILGVIPAPPTLPADVAEEAEVAAAEAAPEPAASVAVVPLAQLVVAAVDSPVPSSLAAPAASPESQVAAAAPSAPEPTASAAAAPSLPAPVQPVVAVAVAEPSVTAAPVVLAPGQTTAPPDEGPVATAPVALAPGQTTAAPDEGPVVAALPEPAASPAQPAVAAARVAVPSAVPDDVAALPGGREPQIYGAEDGEARVVIAARQDSWVQITGAAGELLLTRILRAGDRYLAPLRDDLVLMTGNAGALEITVDGTVVPPLGPLGTVRRYISLAPDRLLAGTAVER